MRACVASDTVFEFSRPVYALRSLGGIVACQPVSSRKSVSGGAAGAGSANDPPASPNVRCAPPGVEVTSVGWSGWTLKTIWMWFAAATGSERSRNAFSWISAGWAASQKTVIRFCVMPRSVSVGKNVAPPSSAYLPASSVTPKRTAPRALAARQSASASGSRRQQTSRLVMAGGGGTRTLSERADDFREVGRSRLCLEPFQHGFEKATGAEADRIVRGQARRGLGLG